MIYLCNKYTILLYINKFIRKIFIKNISFVYIMAMLASIDRKNNGVGVVGELSETEFTELENYQNYNWD